MNWNAAEDRWIANLPVTTAADKLDFVFNNGAGTWHNNNGQDWHFDVTGTQAALQFVMDGALDTVAESIAANGGRHLYAALLGDTLYVATEDAGEGNDVFIYVAETTGALRNANWAKSGQIAGWDAYLADENNNDYEGWFDAVAGATQATTGPNGGVLEGTINLAMERGVLPDQVYLAVGVYANNDNGALVASQQVPASANGNGDIDASEFVLFQIIAPLGDYNRDGDVDTDDYELWRSTFGSTDLRADGNKDNQVDAADFIVWRNNLGVSGGASLVLMPIDVTGAAVPEPATSLLVFLASLAVVSLNARRLPS
jgi:hypothetical protein